MSYTVPERAGVGCFREIAGRCAELGMPLAELDRAGVLLSDGADLPACVTPAVLAGAAARWADQRTPEPLEADLGVWLLPSPVVWRRERTGYFVAALDTADPAHRAHTEATVRSTHRLIAWMHEDAASHAAAESDLGRVTDELMNTYETVHTLYGIGRAMGQVRHPREFVQGVVDELGSTLPFAWLSCVAARDATGNAEIDGVTFRHGSFPGSPEEQGRVRDALMAAADAQPGDSAILLPRPPGLPESLGPQLVGQPVRRHGRVVAMLLAGSRTGDEPEASSYETLMLEASGGFLGAFLENTSLYAEQERTFVGTIRAMTAAIDAKDRYTRGHSERVAKLSRRIALAAGIDAEAAEEVYIAGLVHDVGKIGVPEAVLTKNGRLTDEEFEVIKRHPDIGYGILSGIPSLQHVLPGVLHHHEKWDGSGYPHGLSGESIPLMARVIGLADTFDAMSSTRSYRSAMPRDEVLAEIARCAGTQFDPTLARVFETVDLREYDALVEAHRAASPAFEPTVAPAA